MLIIPAHTRFPKGQADAGKITLQKTLVSIAQTLEFSNNLRLLSMQACGMLAAINDLQKTAWEALIKAGFPIFRFLLVENKPAATGNCVGRFGSQAGFGQAV